MRFERLLPQNSKRREIVKKIYSRLFGKYNTEERKYLRWIKNNEPTIKELDEQRNHEFTINPKISIIVPVYNTPQNFFDELIQSLKNQTYPNWELCLADGSPESIEYMKKYAGEDDRIKYKEIGENKGISGNTNEALSLATGDFIGLLDHDDLLPAFSLYEVVKCINEHPDVEFIYSDEDKIETIKGPRYGAFFKPDFSPYTLNSANYICHFSVFKKELIEKINGFNSKYDGSQDWDIVARASENTDKIEHIAKILYHWRVHQNSTAGNADSKPYAYEIGKQVIKDHVKRSLDTDIKVEDGLTPGSYEVKYSVKDNPKVSIIIDGRNARNIQKLIDAIKISTYKNYEIIAITNESMQDINIIKIPQTENYINDYNMAVEQATGEYFMLVDSNLIRIDKPTYIEELVGICQDKNVGIVGTKLYNKHDNIEHCGIILGMNGTGDLLYKGVPKNAGTYMQRLLIIHNVSCVYTKYSMIKKQLFIQIGKFNGEFTGLNTSIDMCLRILSNEKQVVLNPLVSICVEKLNDIEKEKTEEEQLQEKWNKAYQKGDAYFSPNLSKSNTNLAINI